MRYDTDRLVFSPSDLIVYLSGDYPSWMDRWYLEHQNGNGVANELGLPLGAMLEGVSCVPDEDDDELMLLAEKDAQYERRFLQQLRDDGHEVVEIDSSLPAQPQLERTLEAMRAGAAYIYQGRLEHDGFTGLADFLVREDGPSSLGDRHHGVWDTKLARSLKPSFIVQLSSYSEMLATIQGRPASNTASASAQPLGRCPQILRQIDSRSAQ